MFEDPPVGPAPHGLFVAPGHQSSMVQVLNSPLITTKMSVSPCCFHFNHLFQTAILKVPNYSWRGPIVEEVVEDGEMKSEEPNKKRKRSNRKRGIKPNQKKR